MRLNKSTIDAMRIVTTCARAGGRLVKAATLAEQLELSPQNVFKLVHLLTKAGFLAPVRGRNGGIRLARPAVEITVGEVVRNLERMLAPDGEHGELGGMVGEALEAFIAVLDQHTVADVASAGEARASRPGTPRHGLRLGRATG